MYIAPIKQSLAFLIFGLPLFLYATNWQIESTEDWQKFAAKTKGVTIEESMVVPVEKQGTFHSTLYRFDKKQKAIRIVFEQSPAWLNWTPVEQVGPVNLRDAPVLLALGPENYWIFGRYGEKEQEGVAEFTAEEAELEGFDVPLKSTPYQNQYDAPGGLKKSLGGYHAWQSRDMVNWVHHGPVSEHFSRWMTTAEFADGKAYLYYDYPNDQDPHLYIDDDLTDGVPGTNMGMAFKDPSDGSDCAIIRDRAGNFHIIYEDWSPIDASKHSWDSPLAGHAVSKDGISDFQILSPAVDHRTTPTGEFIEYNHPHWKQHPDWDSSIARYEKHEPEQDAYGDWAAIAIGEQYYLFGDFHPAGAHKSEMEVAMFTSPDLGEPFEFFGSIGKGHPDPDIIFAEEQFYLVTQTPNDFVSPGPWVEKVEARVGVDVNSNGEVDEWTDWQEVKETYAHIPGFAKQIERVPAAIDLSGLPAGYGFSFEYRFTDMADNDAAPVMDTVTVFFQ